MYRVMIVDDEPEIRLGLKLKADWDSLGLAVVAEASNGIEALERLAAEAIDLVITDMNMPVMNGISFLESSHEQYPGLKIIVITGYEDFHYARAAVRNQARDYLLKPVAQDELMAALSKVTQELNEERSLQNEQAEVRWRLSQYYIEMKEHFIVHLVKEELKRGQAEQERAELFLLREWNERIVRFLTVGFRERKTGPVGPTNQDDKRTPDKLRLPFEMICQEFAQLHTSQPQVFRDPNYPGLMHFIIDHDDDAAASFVEELRNSIAGYLSFEPSISIGQTTRGFNKWKEGYMSSLIAWNLLNSEIGGTAKEYGDGRPALTEDVAKIIQRQLARGELELFTQTVHKELTEAFVESQVQFVKLVLQLYLLLDSMAYTAGVQLDTGEQLWVRPDMVLALDTIDKAQSFLAHLGEKIDHKTKADMEDPEQSMIQAALQFIDSNYMYEINLTMLADRFSYNSSYFSELFKSKVGKTFIQYVTEVRMAQAMRLLVDTPLSLWDIAELTGFSNASYFSSKFKRMYGMTPSDFRQSPPEKFNNELPKK
ncbi:two-component system, response regulator YesN [Paenibacillus sp. 1_12]|uniref:response regulator transcription factor n=1 Tax=Paenibacillus sp. 1_12 TaxID=1566278 RepID=UPI0008DF8D3C|nr:response regulator [Paenibacillus sp. 1_12]SFM02801.1 two-component system, response regulator YesN [Paenibacillus sp. 1_12]